MIYPNLQSFLASLRACGELVEIDAEVDPVLEVAEIHRRVIAAGGPALLFKNVKGKSFPLVTNIFGTAKRVDMAFGDRPKKLIEQVAKLPEELVPPTPGKLWQKRDLGFSLLKVGFRKTRNAPVLSQRMATPDLTKLPAITSWIEDGGPFLTLPLVHTKGYKTHADNLGMYRVQIFEPQETGLHFQIGKGGGFHLMEHEEAGKPMPVNIYLGGPPSLILSAIAPLPENVPELLLASLALGDKLNRGSSPQIPLNPVAEAEFCIVGEAPAGVRRPEGPFGDHYGYYSLVHDYPVLKVKDIYHRPGAVFPATVVGKPRQEDFFLGDYLQELLLPMISLVMPAVRDIWSYGETGYHSLAAAVLKERYGRESMASVFRILGEGQLSLQKFLLAVDQPIDLRNFKKVLIHILERVMWEKDLFVFSELSMDTLDYTGPEVNKGSKGVILGIGEKRRDLPHQFAGTAPAGLVRDVRVYAPGCLVVEVPSWETDKDAVAELAKCRAFSGWQLIVAVDDAKRATMSDAAFLWTTFTRFEPAADIHAASYTVNRHHLSYQGPIVIDARMKPWYPKELFCDPDTAKTVDRRWREYFPTQNVEMGDSGLAHLDR
jgi:UbiD family decarboxylase